MKQWKQGSAVAAAVMMLASGGAHALGLGVPTTRAVLGESLRMSIPMELAPGEDVDDGCPQAEVFYGESRLDAGKVILGISPQSGRHRVMTVRAIQPINEPLLDVTISYGCEARLSRKFTVFASPPEFVPTVVLSPATTSVSADDEAARAGGGASALPATGSARASSARASAARDPVAVPRATRPVPVRRPAKVPAPSAQAQPRAAAGANGAGVRTGARAAAGRRARIGAHARRQACACRTGPQGLVGRAAQAATCAQAGTGVTPGARPGRHPRGGPLAGRRGQCGRIRGAAQPGHLPGRHRH